MTGALDGLVEGDLGFDLVVRWWQLPLSRATAQAYPDVRFVVDHLGGVAETDDVAGWATGLRELARLPNVWAKISGLAGMAGPEPERTDGVRHVVHVALEAFGPERLMYGSDWPVAELGTGAVAWRAVVDQLIGELGPAEREAIRSGTGSSFYRVVL